MMPVLFLDVDGVLNSEAWMRSGNWRGGKPETQLDPACCARLERIIVATRCELVLSSSWRITHQRRNRYGVQRPVWFERMLRKAGVPHARFVGQTPSLSFHRDRSHEIRAWLEANPRHDVFAIVDDDTTAGTIHPGQFVRTDGRVGLTEANAGALVWLLGGR